MIYNYLELDSLNEWPKEKKISLLKLLNIDLINLTQFTHGYRIDMLRNVLIYSKRALTVDWYIQRRQYPKKNLNTYNSL